MMSFCAVTGVLVCISNQREILALNIYLQSLTILFGFALPFGAGVLPSLKSSLGP